MPFQVIDPKTGNQPVYDGNHIGKEKWFINAGLHVRLLDDWVITENGSLALTDSTGLIAYPPPGRYKIEWEAGADGVQKIYTAHEVAEIIAEAMGDECACNINGNDEWLPEFCEFAQTVCPDPEGVACWEQWLKWRDKRPKEENDDLD
jgi:hypothetical protein